MSTVDKQKSSTSRLWSLDPVVAELQLCPAMRAMQIEQLMIPGRMSYLDSATGAVSRKFGEDYTASSLDMPKVPTLKPAKDPHNMFPRSLQRLLRKDDSWLDEAQFYPPLGPPLCLPMENEKVIKKIARNLVDGLDDVYNMRYATTLTFRSPTLDRYVKPLASTPDDKSPLLQAPMNTASIMHCGALLPLEASALVSSSEIHLLTGIRVYIVYPPIPHNMTVVQKYYTDLSQRLAVDHVGVCEALKNGITFVQRPGQIVTIPPYCPTVVFATETSAAITVRARCKEGLLLRLKHLELLVNQIAAVQRLRGDPVDVPTEYHVIQLYKDLAATLRALEHNDSDHDFVSELRVAWRQNDSRFRMLVKSHVSGEAKNYVLGNIPKLWNAAIRNQGLGKYPVCDGNTSESDVAFIPHFQEEHWQQALENDVTEGGRSDAAGRKRSLPSTSEDEVNEHKQGNKRARLGNS